MNQFAEIWTKKYDSAIKKWQDKWWKHFSANSETIWWLELFPYRDQHLDATCRIFLSFVMFWTGVLFWGFFPHLGHHKDFFAVVLGAPHNLWGLKVVFGRTCGCKCLFRFVLCHATVTPVVPHLMFHLETSCGTKCKVPGHSAKYYCENVVGHQATLGWQLRKICCRTHRSVSVPANSMNFDDFFWWKMWSELFPVVFAYFC